MLKVIVVDDEPLARKGMLVRLKEFTELTIIAECSNGEQAIESIRQLQPDLVFLDVEMPGIDGFFQLHVGRRQHPHVDRNALARTQAHHFALLQNPQQPTAIQ